MVALEHELLIQVRCGNYDAFEQLQVQLEPSLRRFIRRLVGVSDSEDDIIQNVFIALYYKLDKIDPIENLRPYVFRMVRNRCYDELRSQGRFEVVSLDDDFEPVRVSFTAAAEPEPEDAVHWLLLQIEVQQAMQRLPELQRQTLIFYAEENLTYAEIAVAMDTNIGTVKSRLHHAKKALYGLLKPATVEALRVEFREGSSDE